MQPRELSFRHIQDGFSIGAVHVGVFGNSEADVALIKPLEPFRLLSGTCDIGITVKWVRSIPLIHRQTAFDSGTTWRVFEIDNQFAFDFHSPLRSPRPFKRLLIDREFHSAVLEMSSEYYALLDSDPEPLGYPLDELLIMHRLTQEKAIELHGCGIVGRNGVGNLFVGHSGAGKSTTTRLWTAREDVEVLSDDRIIVRQDSEPRVKADLEAPCETTAATQENQVLRLRDGSASRTRHSAQDDKARAQFRTRHSAQDDKARAQFRAQRSAQDGKARAQFRAQRFAQDDKSSGIRMYGTPWHGEAMFASPNSAPLSRIFILEHGQGQGNVITRLSRSQAVAELFARSFVPFHRHEYLDSALSFLEQVADSVSCYRYAFEPDEKAVDKILNFHD